MPNHVTNRLTISGSPESVAELRAACLSKVRREIPDWWNREIAKGGEEAERLKQRIADIEADPFYDVFDFNRIVPTPAFIASGDLAFRSREEQTGRNWYEWNSQSWGTKWNAYDLDIVMDEPGNLVVRFDTAWNKPGPVIRALAQWFPELRIQHEYFDEGWNFCGIDIHENGQSTEHCETDENANPDLFKRLCVELKGYDPEAE